MKDGVVVETGTHRELMARNGLYHELVSAQVFSDIDPENSVKLFYVSLQVFSKRAGDPELKADGHFWALMFLVLGGIDAIINFTQV
ncbi:unnamed protein product [Nippostrongylus brasiliensis]|uniref:ABC transmembrane type-1 domain-containing protein n=1 Tax=Nippostrongylus brasiliensis TaxID=27835 RepID=A0A0N4XND8_NIPBR|nr:unnamed protein product [Nippostrongylus brasiliensis]